MGGRGRGGVGGRGVLGLRAYKVFFAMIFVADVVLVEDLSLVNIEWCRLLLSIG